MLAEPDMEGIVGIEVAKGKRTKRRLKPLSSPATAAVTDSSCSSASGGGGGSISSTTFEGTDQEEEDMANCLILLAQGGDKRNPRDKPQTGNSVTGNSNGNRVGFYVYECKTCNRSFPSFQALGGHRASHKKPKMTVIYDEKKPPQSLPPPPPRTQELLLSGSCEFQEIKEHVKINLQLGCGSSNNRGGGGFNGNNKSKIHECSICGSEFNSGQALGGHMRRHRASTGNNNNNNTVTQVVDAIQTTTSSKRHRNVLELDLNLPAPEDDLRDSKFPFPVAAPALVGCHY